MWTGGDSKKSQIFCGYGSHLMSYSLPTLKVEERQGASKRQKGEAARESLLQWRRRRRRREVCGSKHVLNNAVQSHLAPSRISTGCSCARQEACNPSLLLKHLVHLMMGKYDGGGRRAGRALFGKKMPAAANIDSVAVNGADGLRSQWREGVNTKHHMRGLFLTKCQWPSNSESQETFTPLLYSHKPLTKNNPLL